MGVADYIQRNREMIGRVLCAFAMAMLIASAGAASVSAQKKTKDQPPQPQPTMLSDSKESVLNQPDERAIDTQISVMLGAWQVGGIDRMHECYADDVLVVSGGPQPPISGWANYLVAYQGQRAHMSSVHLDRTNTFTKVTGNTAWSTYQWDFNGVVDGKNTLAHGHTTLALEKRDGHWLIVLNHTSMAEGAPAMPIPKAGTP
jgi:ketosteroid isomerase-like protein